MNSANANFAATLGGLAEPLPRLRRRHRRERTPSPRPDFAGLGFLGTELEEKRNATNEGVILCAGEPSHDSRHSHGHSNRGSRTKGAAYSSLAEKRGSEL